MKAQTKILAGICALALTACIPSVNPFYSDDDIVFEPSLIGEWTEDPGPDYGARWVFEYSREEGAYELTVMENDGAPASLTATLFELDDHLFLDVIPNDFDLADDQAEILELSIFPGHLVLHVAQIEPQLKMAFFEFDKLDDFLIENPKALSHVVRGERKLLTGSTRELQRFLLRHIEDGWLFDDYSEMTNLRAD